MGAATLPALPTERSGCVICNVQGEVEPRALVQQASEHAFEAIQVENLFILPACLSLSLSPWFYLLFKSHALGLETQPSRLSEAQAPRSASSQRLAHS